MTHGQPAPALVIGRPEDLDRVAIAAIARGRTVVLADDLLAAVARDRTRALAVLAGGEPVYGVNTGMGAQSSVRLSEPELAGHQRNLLLARAVGGPPWLRRDQARALLAVRLRGFLDGAAGVSAELAAGLVELLNADVVPAVPRSGYGSAGEIIPLAHAFGPLTGIGSVLGGNGTDGSEDGGEVGGEVDAAAALAGSGLAPYALGVKEGIALLQGVPGTTAQAILLLDEVRILLRQSVTVAALGIAAARAPLDPYRVELARGDAELAGMDRALLARLAGTPHEARALQAPVSFRVAGVVLAHLARCAAAAGAAVERSLSGIGDSPAFVDGRFLGTAGFHGLDLAACLDSVSVALVHAAEVSAARTHRLLDATVTGLPAQLAARPGPETGLIAVHKRSAGIVHQLRRTAVSSVVGAVETSFGQEDVQSFSWEAAQNAATALAGAREVLAAELLVAAQAVALAARPVGEPLARTLAAVRRVVPAVVGDRRFGVDVEALRRLLADDLLDDVPLDDAAG